MKCSHLKKYSIPYSEGTLPPNIARDLESHVSSCDKCRLELNEVMSTVESLKNASYPAMEPAVDLRSRVMARIAKDPVHRPSFSERFRSYAVTAAAMVFFAAAILVSLPMMSRFTTVGAPAEKRGFTDAEKARLKSLGYLGGSSDSEKVAANSRPAEKKPLKTLGYLGGAGDSKQVAAKSTPAMKSPGSPPGLMTPKAMPHGGKADSVTSAEKVKVGHPAAVASPPASVVALAGSRAMGAEPTEALDNQVNTRSAQKSAEVCQGQFNAPTIQNMQNSQRNSMARNQQMGNSQADMSQRKSVFRDTQSTKDFGGGLAAPSPDTVVPAPRAYSEKGEFGPAGPASSADSVSKSAASKESIIALENELKKSPNNQPVLLSLLKAYGDVGRSQDEFAIARRLTRADSHNPKYWFMLGQAAEKLKQSKAAVTAYKKSIDRKLSDPELDVAKGRLAILSGQPK